MSKFRRTDEFDLDYTEEYKEQIHRQNQWERERKARRERARQKDKQRLEYIKEWNDLNG